MRATAIQPPTSWIRLEGRSEFAEQPLRILLRSCTSRRNLIGIFPAREINTITLTRNTSFPVIRNPNGQPAHRETGDYTPMSPWHSSKRKLSEVWRAVFTLNYHRA